MLNKLREKGGILLIGVMFFLVYSHFNFGAPEIFNSPDETANYFFISQYSRTGDFFYTEPLNFFMNNALHPRSISFNGYSFVSQGFIGMQIFYGIVARFISLVVIKFITPFLAILGALAFYSFLKRIFNKRIAFFSFLLLLFFPVFWYYSSRYLYTNVPFISFLLIAIWAVIYGAFTKGKSIIFLFLFAISFALSLAIRPVEAIWILPIFFLNLILYKKQVSWIKIFYGFILMGFIALPIFYNNLWMYGGLLKSGYTLKSSVTETEFNFIPEAINNSIFIYGFHPRAIWENFYNIIIKFYWWYSIPALLGVLIWIFNKKSLEQKRYLLTLSLLFLWLLIFYGSGIFFDNPNIGRLTIGDSHFRYWLPIFAGSTAFIGYFLDFLMQKLKNLKFSILLILLIFLFISSLSFYAVFFSLDDGLIYIKKTLVNNFLIKQEVLNLTKDSDIIIVGRQDKIFFPERRIIFMERLMDDKLLNAVSGISIIDFYYYSIGINNFELTKMNNFLGDYGFRLKRVGFFGKEALYKLERINKLVV